MPDFHRLKTERTAPRSARPRDIFNRLVKPPYIRDLLPGQVEVLDLWWKDRTKRDVIIKQNTGGGKTLVGILIAESTMAEARGSSVLYLCPNKHLVSQTIEKAGDLGIHAERYERERPFPRRFQRGEAMLVATYAALFNGRSRFGIAGGEKYAEISTIILDDAHVELAALRDSFTLTVNGKHNKEQYDRLITLLAPTFSRTGRDGTLADILEGKEYSTLEVPYWEWTTLTDHIADILRPLDSFEWPFLRDELRNCHCFIGRNSVSIVPIFPTVDLLPSFANASRRVYMSATLADDTALAATFGLSKDVVENAITSKSLASIGERMILVPGFNNALADGQLRTTIAELATNLCNQQLGVVFLTPSTSALKEWKSVVTRRPDNPDDVEVAIHDLQTGTDRTPLALANRYDGIDLAHDACRLLIMDGLPQGRNAYESYRAAILLDSGESTASMAQRVEQGLGRGSRGVGDWCAVLVLGDDLVEWISREANWRYMTASTRAQIGIGEQTSGELRTIEDLRTAIMQCISRDQGWVEYHQEQLVDRIEAEETAINSDSPMILERKAFEVFRKGDPQKASRILEEAGQSSSGHPKTYKAWFLQMAGRYAWASGDETRAMELQRNAFSLNKNLLFPPTSEATYVAMSGPAADQASGVLHHIDLYTRPQAYVPKLTEALRPLCDPTTSPRKYEAGLAELGTALGFVSERPDSGRRPRKGPDVIWLAPNLEAFVIEAKNGKGEAGHLSRDDHGQLLQAAEWFKSHYHDWTFDRVAILPNAKVTESVDLGETKAWSTSAVKAIVDDLVGAIREIVSLPKKPRRHIDAVTILTKYRLTPAKLRERFVPFSVVEDRAGEKIELIPKD